LLRRSLPHRPHVHGSQTFASLHPPQNSLAQDYAAKPALDTTFHHPMLPILSSRLVSAEQAVPRSRTISFHHLIHRNTPHNRDTSSPQNPRHRTPANSRLKCGLYCRPAVAIHQPTMTSTEP